MEYSSPYFVNYFFYSNFSFQPLHLYSSTHFEEKKQKIDEFLLLLTDRSIRIQENQSIYQRHQILEIYLLPSPFKGKVMFYPNLFLSFSINKKFLLFSFFLPFLPRQSHNGERVYLHYFYLLTCLLIIYFTGFIRFTKKNPDILKTLRGTFI